MRKLLLTTVALAPLSVSAFAADLPRRTVAPPPPAYVVPIFTWTGFYVGVNAGGAWNDNRCNGFYPVVNGVGVPAFPSSCVNNSNNNGSFIGGAQAGYNWQFGSIVAGLETDIDFLSRGNNNNGGTFSSAVVAAPYAGTYIYGGNNNNTNYLGTVRARLGYAADRALFYVTGGLAYGNNNNNNNNVTFYSGQLPPVVGGGSAIFSSTNNNNNSNVGWALGGGIEYAFSDSWSGKIEYLHASLGNNNGGSYTCTDIVGGTCAAFTRAGATYVGNRNNNGLNIVRAGLNYRFGGTSSAPVLAKY